MTVLPKKESVSGFISKFSSLAQGNIYYEQANVLFNAAVVCSQLGSSELRKSSDSCKSAMTHFQTAAGIFAFIKESLLPNIPEKVCVDLSSESLEALQYLMLASAQQCIYEMSCEKQMKHSNLTKLAFETSILYELAVQQMTNNTCAEDYDKYITGYCSAKKHLYEAAAHYHLGLHSHDEMEVGKEITRLKVGLELIAKAKSTFYVPNEIKKNYGDFSEILTKQLKTAENENAKVYHDRVPKPTDLDPLEGYRLAKVTPLIDIAKELSVNDPYFALVPLPVMEAKQRYAEMLGQKTVVFFKNTRINRDKVKAELARLGLPGLILASEKSGGFPEQIHKKIGGIQQIGGVKRLKDFKQTLDELSFETVNMTTNINDMLDKEAKDDEECRNKYGKFWSRLPSYQLTQNMIKQIGDYKSKVQLAQKSDQLISTKIQQYSPLFQIFGLTRYQLDASMPKHDLSDSSEASKAFNDLKQLMQEMEALFSTEEQIDQQLKQYMQTEDIQQSFLLKQDDLEKAIKDQLALYDEKFLNQIIDIQTKVDAILKSIYPSHQQLMKVKGSNQQSAKEKAVQDASDAINKFDEINANISEGIQFYTAMQDYIRKASRKVEDFCFARRTEKQDLIENIMMNQSGIQMNQSNMYGGQQGGSFNQQQQQGGYGGQQQNYQQQNYQQSYNPYLKK
jgi:programmed cell death 6-interacting protein